MPNKKTNKFKNEVKSLLASNGRRLNWLCAQIEITRQGFHWKINNELFEENEKTTIRNLIINGKPE